MSYQLMNDDQQSGGKFFDKIKRVLNFSKEDQQNQRDSQIDDVGNEYKKPAFMVTHMPTTFINMEKSFEYVGDNSTFQKRITTILIIQWVSFSLMVNAMAFFFRSPTFYCRVPLTSSYITCPQSMACREYQMTGRVQDIKLSFDTGGFLSFQQTSIIQEFELFCQKENYIPYAQSLFFLGGFVSGFIFSYISEKIGRRSILLIIQTFSIASIIICALAPNINTFLIGYFFTGFSLFGYETSVYIYIGQISAIRFRTISISVLTMVFVGTPIFLPLLSLIPTWRYAFVFFAGLIIITFPLTYKCFAQSPRFLLSKGCYQQARQVFRLISVTNRRPPYDFKLLEEIQRENQTYIRYECQSDPVADSIDKILTEKPKKSYNYVTLFKYASLRKPTLVLMYLWIVRFFMYFSLNLSLESILKSGIMLSIAIALGATMEIMGTFGVSVMTTFLFRQFKIDIIKFTLLVISCCMLVMWFLKVKQTDCHKISIFGESICVQLFVTIILVLLVKFFNTAYFSTLIVYYSEVFPTPVRSLGCGFTLTVGRLGTTLLPFYINYMKQFANGKIPLSFLAPFVFVGFVLCLFMPVTQVQGMRQKIKQQEEKQVFQMVQIGKSEQNVGKYSRTI